MVQADVSTSSADDQNDVEVQTLATIESRAAPTDVLRDFQHYQVLKRQHTSESTRHASHPVDSRTGVVPGIAGHYSMRHGMQYYRDLAGNVKQVSDDTRQQGSDTSVIPKKTILIQFWFVMPVIIKDFLCLQLLHCVSKKRH